jgi:hypothetical protein
MILFFKKRVCRGFQLLFAFIAFSGLFSCVSLNHNYLGKAKRDPAIITINNLQFSQMELLRKKLDIKADSLINTLSLKKKNNRHLNAAEINQLYANFHVQLDFDRIFNSILQTRRKKQSFTSLQRLAGAYLLKSALNYDQTYQKNKYIRRAINRGDVGNKIPRNILQKSRKFLYSPKVRKKLTISSRVGKSDLADSLLKQLPSTNLCKSAYYGVFRQNDRISAFFYNIFPYAGNSLFGKVGNRITNRVRQKKYATQLLSVLEPYDILISKSTGHLTSVVIPGHFGHASLWLGDKAPQKRKKIMSVILKDRSTRFKIKEKKMAEALRNGVQLSNLEEYADGDEFLVIRPSSLTEENKKNIVENTMKHLHKKYDFNFDIESPDMINCTELVYLAYDFIEWKVRYFMGRYTLFPDDLLITALTSDKLKVVAFLKNGEMKLNPDPVYIKTLIK